MTDCRVLIIEDEYFLGEDLAKELRALGIRVVGPCPELSDAKAVRPDDFDLAVIDINLRGYSSYPIADELMRIGKPFIFATGYGAETIPERFRHVRRWEKPYQLKKLAADVAELCQQQGRSVVAM